MAMLYSLSPLGEPGVGKPEVMFVQLVSVGKSRRYRFLKWVTPVLPYTLGCTSAEVSVTATKRTVLPSLAARKDTISSPEPMPVMARVVQFCPCRALYPSLESLAAEFEGKAVIAKVNVDAESEISTDFGIRSIPALLYFKKGELAGKQIGLQSKTAMAASLDQLINQN